MSDQAEGKSGRREFFKMGLSVLAVAGAGAIGIKAGQASASAAAPPPGPTVKALSANGQLVDVAVGTTTAEAAHASIDPARIGVAGRRWVMVIDLARCDGCGACSRACSKMHFIPPDRQWIRVLKMPDPHSDSSYNFPQPCYHCDNPPCTKVCPVDATFKRQDGIVLIDNNRCIGCRFCMAACPYSARHFNWSKPEDPAAAQSSEYSPERGYPRRVGTVEKCDFCPDMAAKGMLPACASACPMNAIYYGDENEDAVTSASGETVRLSELLKANAGYRFMEELGTKPRVYYLPPRHATGTPAGPGGH